MAITFKRIAPHEARIYEDGDCIGDILRQRDILRPHRYVFVIHLVEDHRGPVRVHDRSRIRQVAERMLATHPLF